MKLPSILIAVSLCQGQTLVDLRNQGKTPDFGSMTHTRPVQTGPTLPSSCNVGELFFSTSADNGQNLHGCVAGNSWEKLTGLGQCTVTGIGLSCTGSVSAGSGSEAGEVQLFEKTSAGTDFISWLAPDSVETTYRLQLPGAAPSDQMLVFAPIAGGISQASWVTRFTKTSESPYYPTAHKQGADGWTPGANWTLPEDPAGATPGGEGTSPFYTSYLRFPSAEKRYAVLQTKIPSGWDGQSVTAKLVWAVRGGAPGANVKWQASAACVEDGQSLLSPTFSPVLEIVVAIPYPGDTALKRITSMFSPLVLSGCTANSLLYVLISRDGVADTNSTPALLFGAHLDFAKGLQ